MKHLSTFLAALLLVITMQGCGNGPVPEPELPDNPDNPTQSAVQMHLKGNISAITPATRVNADGFEANDKVGVYVSATGSLAQSANMLNNEAFTYAGGNITAPEGKEVYWGTPNVRLSVWAYYPYVESISNNAAYPFAVATDQSLAADFYDSDFITAQATDLAPQAEAVNLTFNHSLSKIAVTLTKGTGITDEEWAAATKRLSVRGVVVDGTIDLADGTATTGTTKGEVKSFANGGTYSSIVYPQDSEITFRLEMGDDIYTYTTDADYEAGYEYDYSFTINASNPQQMTLNTTTITPWGNGGETEMGAMSDIISFTDAKFKEYLLGEDFYAYDPEREGNITYHFYNTGTKIDANHDGEISASEAERVVDISLSRTGIQSLDDLKHFPNLLRFSCYNEALSTIELSQNTKLIWLVCSGNQITNINLTNLTALQYFQVGAAPSLTSLDVSKNIALVHFEVGGTELTTLDLWHNVALEKIYCWDNKLTGLNLNVKMPLKVLNCRNNQLTSLNVSNFTKLESLDCQTNKLSYLDVTKNVELTHLYCGGNQLMTLDVSNNTALTYLGCHMNKLTSLDVSNNTALTSLVCYMNKLTSLDVSNNLELSSLWCTYQDDEQGNNLLETIYIAEGQEIEHINIPEETVIEEKDSEQSFITITIPESGGNTR